MSPPIWDSVVAVPTFGDDLYLCQRQPQLLAFPGYHSFPGGKLDPSDRDEPFGLALLDAHPPRLMRALVRELLEEVALDLEAAVRAGTVRGITALGTALTPPLAGRPRFNAHFFRIDFAHRPELQPHASELSGGQWRPCQDWLAQDREGRLICVTPTRRVIECLSDGAVTDLHHPPPPDRQLPTFTTVRGLVQIVVPSNTLPPADATNAFLIGDRDARRILVDPSPKDAASLDALIRTVDASGGIDEIFLTHQHPDHRERANELARHYEVPLGMSATTRGWIGRRAGDGWFDGVQGVNLYADGEILTRVLGQPVRTLAVPGHDAGHMALMPDSRTWCIVGDLIQGVGTVVVGGEEGDMRLYFESLQRIIDLAPAAIVPSHGTVMGTTFRLEETLRHRLRREQQVLDLHRQGRTVEQMLAAMYKDAPSALLGLARLNIESHLAKLRDEGRLRA